MRLKKSYLILLLTTGVMLSCSTLQKQDSAPKYTPSNVSAIPNAVPKNEPLSQYGNPEKYTVFGKDYYPLKSSVGFKQSGNASWYGTKFHGQRTSSGEAYDMYAMTAAHKRLPLPSYVRVTNQINGKSIVVKVNDRGPFHDGRIIDLSYVAALKLDIVNHGTAPVEIEAIDVSNKNMVSDHFKILQVGAYAEKENAERVKLKLAKADIASDIEHVIINARKHLYRVQIGPVKEQQHIDNVMRRLEEHGFSNVKIITSN